MSTIGISLADNGITACLWDGRESALIPLESGSAYSPGYAYLGDRGLILGEGAIAAFKLNPSRTTDRFWDQLSLAPSALAARSKPISHAHLAYIHLKMVWDRISALGESIDSVGFAVPGQLLTADPAEEERLGILLGIVSDLSIPISSLLPIELSGFHYNAPDSVASAGVVYHLDVHQYRTHLYRLSGLGELRSQPVGKIPDCGFHPIVESLHSKLAQRFLSETAFDISEDLEVEQLFFEKIRKLLYGGHQRTMELSIPFEGRQISIQLGVDLLERLVAPFTERIADTVFRSLREDLQGGSHPRIVLQLTGRAAALPGLAAFIQRHAPLPVEVITAERGEAAAGAARIAARFKPAVDLQHTPVFSTWKRPELGMDAYETSTSTSGEPSEATLSPTHLLYGSIAFPIASSGVIQGRPVNGNPLPGEVTRAFQFPWPGSDLRLHPSLDNPLKVNDRPASGEFVLKTGDSLSVSHDGKFYQLRCIHCPPPSPSS